MTISSKTIGYLRVSTIDQDIEKNKADILKISNNKDLGLVVWKLDRLGRSMSHLIETIKQLETQGVGFRSVTENIDTTTPGWRLVFHLFSALAEFECDLIRERVQAGLKSARARGRKVLGCFFADFQELISSRAFWTSGIGSLGFSKYTSAPNS